MAIKLKIHFPISTFEKETDLILKAAEGDTYGGAIADRLDADLVPNGRALWNKLFKPDEPVEPPPVPPPVEPPPGSSAAQQTARGAIGTLNTQKALLKIYKPLAKKARDAGEKAFKGDSVKLRNEFRIGVKPSNVIDKIVSEGRLILTAVRNPANTALLKSKAGYIKKDADALETALNNLSGSETSQEDSKGIAKGATDVRNQNINDLYDIALTIQSAAKNEFSDRQSQSAFRIGIFPPKEKGESSSKPTKPSGGSSGPTVSPKP